MFFICRFEKNLLFVFDVVVDDKFYRPLFVLRQIIPVLDYLFCFGRGIVVRFGEKVGKSNSESVAHRGQCGNRRG